MKAEHLVSNFFFPTVCERMHERRKRGRVGVFVKFPGEIICHWRRDANVTPWDDLIFERPGNEREKDDCVWYLVNLSALVPTCVPRCSRRRILLHAPMFALCPLSGSAVAPRLWFLSWETAANGVPGSTCLIHLFKPSPPPPACPLFWRSALPHMGFTSKFGGYVRYQRS